MMWSLFPWPVLLVIPAMIVVGLLVASRSGFGRSGMGRGCGVAEAPISPQQLAKPPATEDPMVKLRERLVSGEIDLPEFERRLEGLLRSDPGESMPWWGHSSSTEAPGKAR